jgi:hypothetical protein
MDQTHPHSGATYKLVPQGDQTFGVVVAIPDMHPTTVTGFATEADAERWIASHKDRIAKGGSLAKRRFSFRKG